MLREETANGREVIDLARVPPFRLGALLVTPAIRQLERDDRSLTLEPRVMQVLVALWEAAGAVVSRDDLISRCWGGRIVGDNAIHRTISRLRDVAGTLGEGCFRLETVSKVGYRLMPSEVLASTPPLVDTAHPQRRKIPNWVYFAATAAAAIAAVFFVLTRTPAADVTTIAVIGTQDHGAASLAQGAADDLARFATVRGDPVVFARGTDGIRADYQLDIAEQHSSNRTHADATLFRIRSPELIWSYSALTPGNDEALLRERLVKTISRVIACAVRMRGKSKPFDSVALRVLFSACERLDHDPDRHAVELWRQVAASQPNNARALSALALVEAQWAQSEIALPSGLPSDISTLRRSARQHLERARSLDESLGMSYAAEALLIPTSHFAEQIAVLDRGLARDPDCDVLYGLLSDTLQNVGRMDDAVDSARKAADLEPGSAAWPARLALVLAYNGYTETASKQLLAVERVWPDSPEVKDARFHFDFRYGDAEALVREIDAGNQLPNMFAIFQNGVSRAFFAARANPTPKNVADAVKLTLSYHEAPQVMAQNLVALGHTDLAYKYLLTPWVMARMRDDGSYVFFRSYMRPLRLDKRFMALADRLGLVEYWLSSKSWPDFCRDKDLPYNCKVEARRLRGMKG